MMRRSICDPPRLLVHQLGQAPPEEGRREGALGRERPEPPAALLCDRQVELLFKELKQTLQLQDFYGENENAVRWQIWAALLTHLLLRYLKFKSGANCSYTRFVGLVRAVVWLKKDFLSVLRSYGIAPGGNTGESHGNMPYLRGFEKYFTEAVG